MFCLMLDIGFVILVIDGVVVVVIVVMVVLLFCMMLLRFENVLLIRLLMEVVSR